MSSTDCYPEWHDAFKKWRGVRYPGGYSVPPIDQVSSLLLEQGMEDFVPTSPEILRANAELWLRNLGALQPGETLTQDEYSLARNIEAETGSGSAEQKVAMGLSTKNHARLVKRSVHQVIVQNNRFANRYGRIHAHGDTGSAPYGRFTASSKEPSVESLMIARFVMQGGAGEFPNDFALGADDQAQVNSEGWIRSLASQRKYWVGNIPGVDSRVVTLFRTMPDIDPRSEQGQALLRRGLDKIKSPKGAFVPACAPKVKPLAVAGATLGLSLLALVAFTPPRTISRWLNRFTT